MTIPGKSEPPDVPGGSPMLALVAGYLSACCAGIVLKRAFCSSDSES
jgi:hypothetical protein